MANIPVPAWMASALQNLSTQGKLSGVPVEDLEAIIIAEGTPMGAVNPEGYGGPFGTSVKQVGAAEYGTTTADFQIEAQYAAYDFANLLQAHNDNPQLAEIAYQGGSHEGAAIFAKYGIGGSQANINPNAPAQVNTGVQTQASNIQPTPPTLTASLAANDPSQFNPFPGGDFDPLNWPFTAAEDTVSWAFGLIENLVFRLVIVLVALILAFLLFKHILDKDGIHMPQGLKDAATAAIAA